MCWKGDDGKFVAFTSKVNAGSLDATFATKAQLAGSTRATLGDRGDTSYDVFRWQASDGTVRLASRTYGDENGGESQAFGFRTDCSDPAISGDGTSVAFISNRTASVVYPTHKEGNIGDGAVHDSLDDTPDLFLTDFVQIDAANAQNVTVLSKVPNPYPDSYRKELDPTTQNRIIQWQEDYGTIGYASTLRPAQLESWFKWNFLFQFVVYDKGVPTAKSPLGVQVDHAGRYLSSDGKTVTFTTDMHPLFARTPIPGSQTYMPATAATDTGGLRDAYMVTASNVQENTNIQLRNVTLFDPNTNLVAFPLNLTPSLSTLGGSVDNSIIARDNDRRVLITAGAAPAKVFPDGVTGALITGYTGSTGSKPENMNLYVREQPVGSVVAINSILVNAIDGNFTTPGAAVAAPTSKDIPATLRVLLDATSGVRFVDPASYNITPDGRYVVFTSPSSDLVVAGKNVPADRNTSLGAYDVFRRDITRTIITSDTDFPATGIKVGSLIMVSQTPGGSTLQSGNGASYNPTITPDGRFVGFESLASNLVATGIDKNGVSDVYVRDFSVGNLNTAGLFTGRTGLASSSQDGTTAGDQASTNPHVGGSRVVFTSLAGNLADPTFGVVAGTAHGYVVPLPIVTQGATGSTDVGAVGGGFVAGAALVKFTGNGTLAIGDKFTPFPGFTGEVRVAAADVNGDGVQDLIAGAGSGGGPRVVVIDGATGSRTLTRTDTNAAGQTVTVKYTIDVFAYESSFRGGVTVASGDVNGDGFSDLIIGADNGGGSRVRVISGRNGTTVLGDFFAYEASFRGGVRVASADVNGDGTADIITGAGFGGGPRVTVFDGTTLPFPTRLADYFAFEPTLRNGVYVGGGDVDADGFAEVVVGGGPGGGPRVAAFDGKGLVSPTSLGPTMIANFFAFPTDTRNGVHVAVRDIDGDGDGDFLVGQGGGDQSRVRTFQAGDVNSNQQPTLVDDQILFGDFGSLNGAWVG